MVIAVSTPGRLRRLWAGLGWTRWVLAVLVGVAVLALLFHDGGSQPATLPSLPVAPAGLGPTDSDMSTPDAAPNPVTWTDVQGAAVPDGGHVYGPTRVDAAGVQSGYAHTPRGAVIAAMDIGTRAVLGDWQPTANAQLTGPGKANYLNVRGGENGPVPSPCQYAGFQVVAYAPNVAAIDLATQCSGAVLEAATSTVVWENGDWRLVVAQDGSNHQIRSIPDLVGFIPFFPGQYASTQTAG